MVDVDDDFGELYADVEIQASAAVSGISRNAEPCTQQNYPRNDVVENPIPAESIPVDRERAQLHGIGTGKSNIFTLEDVDEDRGKIRELRDDVVEKGEDDEVEKEDWSDSEDDFNIVLNDGDFPAYDASCVSNNNGGLDGRRYTEDFENDDNDFVEKGIRGKCNKSLQYKRMGLHASVFSNNQRIDASITQDDKEDAGYIQKKEPSSCVSVPTPAASLPAIAENRNAFWLPWYRTILDVDIDSFEQKPWRHLGTDIADFFNFGFNEKSWKSYSCSLDQLRRQGSMPQGSAKPMQETKAVSGHEAKVEEIRKEYMKVNQKASQTLDSAGRQRNGRTIQVEDGNGERQPSMNVRRARDRDSDVVIQITLQKTENGSASSQENPGDSDGTERKQSEKCSVEHNNDAVAIDKTSGNSYENIASSSNISSDLKRCSDSATASSPTFIVDDEGNGQVSDSDMLQPHKMVSSDRITETVVIPDASLEDICKTPAERNPSIMDIDLSLDDHVYTSDMSFYSESESEASKNSEHHDPGETQNSRRSLSSNSVSEQYQDSEAHYFSSACHEQHVFQKTRACHEQDVFQKIRACHKHSSRAQSPTEKECKHDIKRFLKDAERKSNNDGNDDASGAFYVPRREPLHDRNYSRGHHHRRLERPYDLAPCYVDWPHNREREPPFSSYDNESVDDWIWASSSRDSNGKGARRSIKEIDPYIRSQWCEKEYYSERRREWTEDEIVESDRRERGVMFQDRSAQTFYEPHDSISRSSVTGRERTWCSGENDDIWFKKRSRNDRYMLDRSGRSDLLGVSSGGEMASMYDEKEEVASGGRNQYARSSSHLDCWSMEDDVDCWNKRTFTSTHVYRDRDPLHIERKHDMLPRDDMHDFELIDRHERHMGRASNDGARDRGYYRHVDAFNVKDVNILEDDYIERRYGMHDKALHWKKDELIYRDFGTELYNDVMLHPPERVFWDGKHDAKERMLYHGMNIGVRNIAQHVRKVPTGSDCRFRDMSSKIINRDKMGQTVLSCRKSVNVHSVVKERKSSERCLKTGQRAGRKSKFLKLQNDSWTRKAMDTESQKVELPQNVGFQIMQQDSDIEEGQIQSEESTIRKEKGKARGVQNSRLQNKTLQNQNAAKKNEVDTNRILETLAKMEKRRERFKEPMPQKKEPDLDPKPRVDSRVETAERKQQRPARKRQWVGS